MKNKVAVICASNPCNAGMYSVDLAAADFLSRNGISYDLFTSHTQSRFARYKFLKLGVDIGFRKEHQFGKLSFKRFESIDDLSSYSHAIYWGDFTPNPVYGLLDFNYYDKLYGERLTKEQSFDRWLKLYNLPNKIAKQKVLAVGNNFQHDFKKDMELYGPLISNLFKKFDVVMPRDAFSYENLNSIKEMLSVKSSSVLQGLDPAFLLRNKASKSASENEEETFCYVFGRSKLHNIDEIIVEIEAITGLKGIHLSHWLALQPSTAELDFNHMVTKIQAAKFIVTDLYHVAINTIRLNKPVYCISNPTYYQTGTLGDFKKDVLFKMLDLEKFLIKVDPNVGEDKNKIALQINETLTDYKNNITALYKTRDLLVTKFEETILSQL